MNIKEMALENEIHSMDAGILEWALFKKPAPVSKYFSKYQK